MFQAVKLWYINLWRDVWCFLTGHCFSPWQDARNGNYWRSCQKCCHVHTLPYIEMLQEERRKRRNARGNRL
jgi:hypothetical protein